MADEEGKRRGEIPGSRWPRECCLETFKKIDALRGDWDGLEPVNVLHARLDTKNFSTNDLIALVAT